MSYILIKPMSQRAHIVFTIISARATFEERMRLTRRNFESTAWHRKSHESEKYNLVLHFGFL